MLIDYLVFLQTAAMDTEVNEVMMESASEEKPKSRLVFGVDQRPPINISIFYGLQVRLRYHNKTMKFHESRCCSQLELWKSYPFVIPSAPQSPLTFASFSPPAASAIRGWQTEADWRKKNTHWQRATVVRASRMYLFGPPSMHGAIDFKASTH